MKTIRTILTIAVLLTASLFTSTATAGAAIVHAAAGAGARGHMLLWSLDYDTVAHTVTVDATHTKFDGSQAIGDPQLAEIVVGLQSGQSFTFDLLRDGTVFDGGAANMLNTGPRVRQSVQLRIGAGRGQVITFSTNYTPPLGA